MSRYQSNPAAISALVRPDSIHRDVYLDPELFELEMSRLWRTAWIYVGHESQTPNVGDFYTTQIGREPVILLRGEDVVRVLQNRCAHKGTMILKGRSGQCVGGVLRCPYHGWTYRLDGAIRQVPLPHGYQGTALEPALGASRLAEVTSRNYRGFVFARLSAQGPDFEEYFGEALTSIDNMVERSPQGRLEVAGGALRYLHDCNWKIFVETSPTPCIPW